MTTTALAEFRAALSIHGVPIEKANGQSFLTRVQIIPSNPSQRVWNLRETGKITHTDKLVFGTGDKLGIPTMIADKGFVRAAFEQGVELDVYIHQPVP